MSRRAEKRRRREVLIHAVRYATGADDAVEVEEVTSRILDSLNQSGYRITKQAPPQRSPWRGNPIPKELL